MKTILFILALSIPAAAQIGPTSRVRLYQTGTIPAPMAKLALMNYAAFGCREKGVVKVSPGYVNVWCLDVLTAELFNPTSHLSTSPRR